MKANVRFAQFDQQDVISTSSCSLTGVHFLLDSYTKGVQNFGPGINVGYIDAAGTWYEGFDGTSFTGATNDYTATNPLRIYTNSEYASGTYFSLDNSGVWYVCTNQVHGI